MRFLVTASLPTDAANAAMAEGKFGSIMESYLSEIKPEAVYFTELDGCRNMVMIVNIEEANGMIKVSEPLFLAFDAIIEWHPVMSPEEVMSAAHHIDAAVKKYG